MVTTEKILNQLENFISSHKKKLSIINLTCEIENGSKESNSKHTLNLNKVLNDVE